MRTCLRTLSLLCLALIASGQAPVSHAAATDGAAEAASRFQAGGDFIRATRLLGLSVQDAASATIGTVKDLVLKIESGGVSHVIVETSVIDRLPGAAHAVPAHRLQLLDGPPPALVLDTTAPLRDMPRWDDTKGRNLIDLDAWDRLHPVPRPRLADRFYTFTLTQLLGGPVRDMAGKPLGKLADLVIDMELPRALFGVITFDPGILSGERNVAVPVQDFLMPRVDLHGGGRLDHLVLNISSGHMRTLRGFDDDHWPDLVDAEQLLRIQGRFITADTANSSTSGLPPDEALTFDDLDRNLDGYINRSEAVDNERLSRRWDEFDSNRDGMISREEFAAGARLPRRG